MRALYVLLFSAALFGVAVVGFAQQQPTPEWERQFTLGGVDDIPTTTWMLPSGKVVVNGWYSIPLTASGGAVSLFTSNGNQEWTARDTVVASTSFFGHSAIIAADNAVVWFYGEAASYSPSWIVKLAENGDEVWRISVNRLVYLGPHTDTSFVSVFPGNNPIATIYDRRGVVVKHFALGGTVEGNVTIRSQGDFLWVGANFVETSGSFSYFVAKYDIRTGTRMWRQEFSQLFRAFGDLDTDGTMFIGGSKSTNESGGVTKLLAASIGENGGLSWQREWYPRPLFTTNYDNFINCAVVVGENNTRQFVMGGSVERSDTGNSPNTSAYAVGLRLTNGDRVWTVERASGKLDRFLGAAKGQSSSFFLTEGVRNTGNISFLLKFAAPTLSVQELPGLPEVFSLSQNYPNPFNPTTTIRFELLSRTPVRLTVHNTLGQEVATLVDETLESGVYETMWNASGTASGTYFYRLTSNGLVQTKKMVLLK